MEKSISNNSAALNSSNDRDDGLTPSQERAVTAMLTARSIAAAARAAEVGESSLRRWLRQGENFQTKLRGLREEALSQGALKLQNGVPEAVETLYRLIARDKGVEPGRASLVRTALEFAYRSSVYNDVMERLKIVEKQAAEK